jgi:hypothetical protein
MILNGEEKARASYLISEVGRSKFPLDELKDAGVDMRSPEPVKKAMAHFAKRVGQLKEEIRKLGDRKPYPCFDKFEVAGNGRGRFLQY